MIRNGGKLPNIRSGSIAFGNILSIRVLEWLVFLVGCKINNKSVSSKGI